jgi:serine/threonine protein kinase
VQSRYYRCPEIVMGLKYDFAVDMWSLGCIISELVTGKTLFPARSESELLHMIRVRIGLPTIQMIHKCEKRQRFFDFSNNMIHVDS